MIIFDAKNDNLLYKKFLSASTSDFLLLALNVFFSRSTLYLALLQVIVISTWRTIIGHLLMSVYEIK